MEKLVYSLRQPCVLESPQGLDLLGLRTYAFSFDGQKLKLRPKLKRHRLHLRRDLPGIG